MQADPKDSQISIRLPDALKRDVTSYAELTGRSKSHVAMEALREYLDWRVPQIEDLREAIAAADGGDFASAEEVDAVVDAYRRGATKQPPTAKTSRRR